MIYIKHICFAIVILAYFLSENNLAYADDYLKGINTCQYTESDPISYDEIRKQAISGCSLRSADKVDTKLIDMLISIEKAHALPPSVRGLLLAASCSESGYNPRARGDWRKNKTTGRRYPKAYGLLQFWPWAKKYIDRDDPGQSANFWLKRIKKQIPHVRKRCKFRNTRKIWFAAHVTAVRAPKKSGRCYEKSRHHQLLMRWHKSIARDRTACWKQLLKGDGC